MQGIGADVGTVGKAQTLTAKGDVYGRKWEKERFESVLDTMLEREYTKNLILVAIKEGFTSVRDISGETGLELGGSPAFDSTNPNSR